MADEETTLLRASAHPLRLRILSLLTAEPMSAAELARELGTTHANASYHLRVLARAGEVVEAGEEMVRGGRAKRYRHPWQERSRQEPQEGRSLAVRTMAQELVRRDALRDRPARTVLCDAEMWVEDDVWEEALQLVQQAANLVHGRARPPRAPGTRKVNLTVAAFGMQP